MQSFSVKAGRHSMYEGMPDYMPAMKGWTWSSAFAIRDESILDHSLRYSLGDLDTEHCSATMAYERLVKDCCYSLRPKLYFVRHLSRCCEDITKNKTHRITVPLLPSSCVWEPWCLRDTRIIGGKCDWSCVPLDQLKLQICPTSTLDITLTCVAKTPPSLRCPVF